MINYGENIGYHRIERNSSKFNKTLRLSINVEAEYKEGILVVLLPRAEFDKPSESLFNMCCESNSYSDSG